MTEFQAAVGVEQLKKIPGYIRDFREGKKILDDAMSGCSWLDERKPIAGSEIAPYLWSCVFPRGKERNYARHIKSGCQTSRWRIQLRFHSETGICL